jgi:rhodanese-related sulfurtransferase
MPQTKSHVVSPQYAHDFLTQESNALLIDIRSSMEYLFVGHPIGATHIAWIDDPDWDINPNFVKEVQQIAQKKFAKNVKQAPIFLICRSGERTKEAHKTLLAAGFSQVMEIEGGFEGDKDDNFQRSSLNGWRYHSLPWEQC